MFRNISFKEFLLVAVLLFSTSAFGQEHSHHSRNEVGINTGITYSLKHKEWGSGTHLHYYRSLSEHSKWSLGGSLEYLMGDGDHYSISAGAKYMVFEKLSFGLMAGVIFLSDDEHHDHDSKTKAQLGFHAEMVYDLVSFGNFHIGPSFDFSFTKGDSHIMPGIHLAYNF